MSSICISTGYQASALFSIIPIQKIFSSFTSDSLSRLEMVDAAKLKIGALDDDSCVLYVYRDDGRRNALIIHRDGKIEAGWRDTWG